MSHKAKPNPGSDEAVGQGCKCPRMDNSYGKGAYGGALLDGKPQFWMRADCPLHGDTESAA